VGKGDSSSEEIKSALDHNQREDGRKVRWRQVARAGDREADKELACWSR